MIFNSSVCQYSGIEVYTDTLKNGHSKLTVFPLTQVEVVTTCCLCKFPRSCGGFELV